MTKKYHVLAVAALLCAPAVRVPAVAAPPQPPSAVQKTIRTAETLSSKSRYEAAAMLLEKARKKLPPNTTKADRKALLESLSDIRYEWGVELRLGKKYDAALAQFGQSYELKIAIDREGVGAVASEIAGCYRQKGQYPEADVYYERSLAAHRQFHQRDYEAQLLKEVSVWEQEREQYTAAAKHCERWIAVAREIGDAEEEGSANARAGLIAGERERFAEAESFANRSLVLMRTANFVSGEVMALAIRAGCAPDAAMAVFWGKQCIATLQANRVAEPPDSEAKGLFLLVMQKLEEVLILSRREGEAETVQKIAAMGLAKSAALPITAEEEAMRAAYEAVAKPVGEAGAAFADDDTASAQAKADASAKIQAAQKAFSTFLKTQTALPPAPKRD